MKVSYQEVKVITDLHLVPRLIMYRAMPNFFTSCIRIVHDKQVPDTTVWHVLSLRMRQRPPDKEGSCEYIE
jgi:hypothetical protein